MGRGGDAVGAVPSGRRPTVEQRFQAMATAYVRFAIADAALMDLMFSVKNIQPPPSLRAAVERFFATAREVIDTGDRAGRLALADPERLEILFVSTLQGIATLVIAGRVAAQRVDELVADAVTLFVRPA